jgi:tagatose 1,6-diphosphate aldolase
MRVGTYRHLTQCSDDAGIFVILALDHRGNLIADMNKHRSVRFADVVAFKTDVLRCLLPGATAALIDPDYSLPALADGAIRGGAGLLAPLEVTDYTPHPSRRPLTMIPNWGVEKIKRYGFSAVKLLIYYHPQASNADMITGLVDQIVEQCQTAQIPFFLEPLSYSMDVTRPLTNSERREIVIDTARHFSRRGVDVLKMEFPLDVASEPDERIWATALDALDAACSVPWALLSAGAPFETFLRQAELACAAGASGVIAGRAIWAEAVALQGQARLDFLSSTGVERMMRLHQACVRGRSWKTRHILPPLYEGWYCEDD